MAHLFRTLAVLPVVHVVNSAWTCPSGWNDKTGVPTCAGAVDSTCSNTQCCDIVPTCSGYSVVWLLSQVAGGGCAADTKFFDLKKTDVEVAAPQGEAQVKAACCTPFANAQCSDWNLMGCPIGKSVVGTNSAPADSSNGLGLSQAKYTEMCCVDTPIMCSAYSGVWLLSQALGGGCAADTNFFDLKKTDVEVAAPQAEAQVKAACCTPFANAQCSDWNLMGCPIGKSVVGTNSAPADSSNGLGLSQAKYTELCCVDPPMMCSAYSGVWLLYQVAGGGCAADTKFFDLKKTDVEVAAPQGEAEVKAACCTPFANAQCSDWNLMGCPSGKYLLGTNSAPADSSDGKVLSNDKFKELCCVDPMKCADYTGEMNSVSQTAASLVVFVLAITAVMAHAL